MYFGCVVADKTNWAQNRNKSLWGLEFCVIDHSALERFEGNTREGFGHAVSWLLVGLDPDEFEQFVAAMAMFAQEVVCDADVSREFRCSVVVC